MEPKSRRAAWIQGIVLVAATAALSATLAARLQRPFDRDTLAIPVGELRSQAAEAALMARQAGRDHLAPAFVRFHAQQLGHGVERVRHTLAGKSAEADLEASRRQALALAGVLQSRVDTLGRDADLARTGDGGFDTLAGAFDALARHIKPED